jgi:uncharacterized membrane protein YidH (DUF202 family)
MSSMADPAGRSEPASPRGSSLARERTVLSWNRSGLALVVCVAVLLRHLWPLQGTGDLVALVVVAVAAIMWAVGIFVLTSARVSLDEEALVGERVFRLITVGTLLLALVGLVLAFVGPT